MQGDSLSVQTPSGPAFLRFVEPIVAVLRELGQPASASDVTNRVMDRLALTEAERQGVTKNGQSRVRNQIAWARFYLAEAAILSSPGHGQWALTDQGRAAALDESSVLTLFKTVQARIRERKANGPFTPEVLRDEYLRFHEQLDEEDGVGRLVTVVSRIAKTPDGELASRDRQEQLWSLDELASVGTGNSVGVGEVTADPAFVQALLAVRTQPLASDPIGRAHELQRSYDELLGLVHPRHSSRRPMAKLARIFSGFFPRDTHTIYAGRLVARLTQRVLGDGSFSLIEGMVRVRARLRDVLGQETGLEEDAQRARFCWYLANLETAGSADEANVELTHPPGDPPDGEVGPPLVPWPFARQRRGLTAVKGYADAFRAVVNACWHGATPDELVVSLRESVGLRQLSELSCKQHIGTVRSFRFVAVDTNGAWHPTDDGRALVDDERPDLLVERFLVETYGLALVLRDLRAGPLTRADQMRLIRERYPAWTNDFGPSSLTAWASNLGLTEELPDKRRALTSYGRAWDARLPDVLPPGPPVVVSGPHPSPVPPQLPPTFGAIYADMRQNLKGFVLDEAQVRSLHVALTCHPHKHFVLLSGLSGTGKTELLRQYGRSVARCLELDPDSHVLVAAVAPDWRDPTGLLGYLNPLRGTATWQRQPALELLLEADANPTRPYFLILDEMNLAQVEHYFAPFLSAMESLDGKSRLHLHEEDGDVDGVPSSIPWPGNLFIGGTLNLDESVHPVSDKVLDRAFTLEFWEVDLAAFLASVAVAEGTKSVLLQLHVVLRKVRRHFGYRTAREVVAFTTHADGEAAMLDQAIFSKVLPKLRGADSPALRQALADAEKICASSKLARCAEKLREMQLRLHETGVTRFWS